MSAAPTRINLASDNVVGASAAVLDAIVRANADAEPSYGADRYCAQAEAALAQVFERELQVCLTATGTAANALALAALCTPWGAVLCHAESHILEDECGAPEFYSGGAKLIGIAGVAGKITPDGLSDALARLSPGVARTVQPAVLSLSQVTEAGTLYSLEELRALTALARRHGLRCHLDGSRYANAMVALDCSAAAMSWQAGFDAVTFGATKNGALACEAVLSFEPALTASLPFQRKRAGHTLSKSRLLGAQMVAYLHDGHWRDNARHANAMATRLAAGLAALPGVRLPWPTQANEVFALVPEAVAARWREAGIACAPWLSRGLPEGCSVGDGQRFLRMVTSYATTPEQIDAVIAAA
ncbi:beta-eliminating lyase-related protein [Lysobacter sp. 5GHs7-4]|uniref:threonine aldolase family protein n=1 Tax=Lysobacter sp. 5GHs7-4 TaxID=2904253 RepID=UPI001E2F7F2E|nr:beta-eliminating lyase-related protein [Lysobacter sp. 5GHs7-4]UHQ21395.1 beta-eliminating lyase-related protein [Lysobacter sp. 5GHs7-4]